MDNLLIGILLMTIGSFAGSSYYAPINKIKNWSWETYWICQGIVYGKRDLFEIAGASAQAPSGDRGERGDRRGGRGDRGDRRGGDRRGGRRGGDRRNNNQ